MKTNRVDSRVDEEGNELDIVVSKKKLCLSLGSWLFALAFEPDDDDDEQEIASRVLVLVLARCGILLARLPTGDDDVLKAEARKTFKMAAVYLCL